MIPFKQPPRLSLLLLGAGILLSTNHPAAAQKQETVVNPSGGYYDSGVLRSGSGARSKKGSKKSSKKHRHKAKRGDTDIIQNPGEPQEDVTDQTEVSDQADQPVKRAKKK